VRYGQCGIGNLAFTREPLEIRRIIRLERAEYKARGAEGRRLAPDHYYES
jgi:hypothetical protein